MAERKLEYNIVVRSDVAGGREAKAAIEAVQAAAQKGLADLEIDADPKSIAEIKRVLADIEQLATKPKPLEIDNSLAIAQAQQLAAEIDRLLRDRTLSINAETTGGRSGLPNLDTAGAASAGAPDAGGLGSNAAMLASLQELQEQAAKGLEAVKVEGDTGKLEEMQKLLEEIDKLAQTPSNFDLSTEEAANRVEELKARLATIDALIEPPREVKVDATNAQRGAKQAAEAIEDLQARAAKGLEKIDLKADPAAAKALEQIIKDIDELARRPRKLAIDNKDAVRDAKEIEKRLEAIAKKSPGRAGFFGRLKSDLADLRSEVPLVAKSMDLLAIAARGPIALLVAAVAGLALGWKGALAAFRSYLAEAPKFAEFDAILARHAALTARTRQEYIQLASALQDATGIADDQWIATISRLIQFGADPRSVGMDVEAVKNLAALMKGDLGRATEYYTRALRGQFEQFGELGIRVDQSISRAEKLAQVQRIAADLGAGILEARTRNAAGSVAALSNEIGDLAEGFGRLIARNSAVQGTLSTLRDLVRGVTALLPSAVEQLDGLQNKMPDLRDEFTQTTEAAKELSEKGIKEVGNQATEADRKLAAYIARIRALGRAELERDNAKLALDLARVDLSESQGGLSSTAAAEQRYALRSEAKARQTEIERIQLQAELGAVESTRSDRQSGVSSREAELTRLLRERKELEERFAPEIERADSVRSEQAGIAEERSAIDYFLEQAKRSQRSFAFAPGAGASRLGRARIQELSDEIEYLTKRREELDARDAELGEIAARFDTEDVTAAKAQGQKLSDQIEAARAALAESQSLFAQQEGEYRARIETLRLELDTLSQVSALQGESASLSREVQRVKEREVEAQKELLRKSAIAGDTAENFAASGGVTPRPGEDRRETGRRGLLADELRAAAIESARALNDGATLAELQDLRSALSQYFQIVDTASRDEARRVNAQLNALTRMVEEQAAQIRNNR